jgi:hypothetical protein
LSTPTDRILEEAKQLSLADLEHLVSQLLALQAERRSHSPFADEAALLLKINSGMSAETRERYLELIEKRRAESLSPTEHEELLQLSDWSEELQAERLEALLELSRLRGVPLRELMDSLGIKPSPVERLEERK